MWCVWSRIPGGRNNIQSSEVYKTRVAALCRLNDLLKGATSQPQLKVFRYGDKGEFANVFGPCPQNHEHLYVTYWVGRS